MSDLLVPHSVAQDRLIEEVNAEVDKQIERGHEITRLLQTIDPNLSIVLAAEDADLEEFEYPGYWYVRKKIPGHFDAVLPLIGPDGERLEPGTWVIEWLDARDLWDPRVQRDRTALRHNVDTARRRAKELEAEQRQDEGRLALRAAARVKGDGGMTRNLSRKGERPKRLVLPAGVDAG
jgi:hypothetical protein